MINRSHILRHAQHVRTRICAAVYQADNGFIVSHHATRLMTLLWTCILAHQKKLKNPTSHCSVKPVGEIRAQKGDSRGKHKNSDLRFLNLGSHIYLNKKGADFILSGVKTFKTLVCSKPKKSKCQEICFFKIIDTTCNTNAH